MTKHGRMRLPGAACAALLLAWSLAFQGGAHAAPAVWRDHATGYAIGGYDPVAYHTRGAPVAVEDGPEYSWGGAVWRFLNTGNRDAFAKHPEVYAPRFAGYDAEALSRGLTVEGNPTVWAVFRNRVYLFRDTEALRAWRADPEKTVREAEANWTGLGGDLPGTSER